MADKENPPEGPLFPYDLARMTSPLPPKMPATINLKTSTPHLQPPRQTQTCTTQVSAMPLISPFNDVPQKQDVRQNTNPQSTIFGPQTSPVATPPHPIPRSSPFSPLPNLSPVSYPSGGSNQGNPYGFPYMWMSTPSAAAKSVNDSGFLSPGMGGSPQSSSTPFPASHYLPGLENSLDYLARSYERERAAWWASPGLPLYPGPTMGEYGQTAACSTKNQQSKKKESVPQIQRKPLKPLLGTPSAYNAKTKKMKKKMKDARDERNLNELDYLFSKLYGKGMGNGQTSKRVSDGKSSKTKGKINQSSKAKCLGKASKENKLNPKMSAHIKNSSSEEDLLNASNMFDEDLEPLDLRVRLGATNDPQPKTQLNTQRGSIKPGREGGAQEKTNSDLRGVEQQVTGAFENAMESSKTKQNGQAKGEKSPSEIQNPFWLNQKNEVMRMGEGLTKSLLPLKKRQLVCRDEGRFPAGAPGTEIKRSVGSGRLCKKCSSDYRATCLVRCPVCSGGAAIQNSTATTNSALHPLTSLPFQLSLCRKDDAITVVTNCVIKSHRLLGPMEGEEIPLREISKDMDVSHLWVTSEAITGDMTVLNTANELKTNWTRFVRVSKDLSTYNLALIHQKNKLYFITMQKINVGQELVLRPIDPMIIRYNVKQEAQCSLCRLNCESPLHLAKHRFFFHPFLKDNLPPVQQVLNPDRPELETQQSTVGGDSASASQTAVRTAFCTQCNTHFKSKAGYRAHVSLVHKRQSPNHVMVASFRCQDCPAVFRSQWNLLRHSKCHAMGGAGCKTYSCPQCGREFWRKQSYRRHVQAHQVSNLQLAPTCDHCGRKFYSSSNLKVHMLTHSGVKPFICVEPLCRMGFTTKQSLQFHYIKRHGYYTETMPRIERNVPFTFEDYGGQRDEKGQIVGDVQMKEEVGDDGYTTIDTLESEVQEQLENERQRLVSGTQDGDLKITIDMTKVPLDLSKQPKC